MATAPRPPAPSASPLRPRLLHARAASGRRRVRSRSLLQSGGFSPAKLRAMLRGLEKHQRNNGEDTSPEANDSGELDDRRSLECSTSTEMSSNSGHRSRNRAPDDDSFDSESSSSGPPTVKRLTAVAALLPPFSRPTPSKWDDAEKWISSPTSNRTGHAGPSAGTVPKKSALAFTEHGGRPPAVAKVVTDVPTNTGPLVKNSDGLVHSDLLKPAHNASIVDGPTPVVRSVSMRDMGTEMTPIANQEPSRTVTPIIASSPTSSRTPTPQRSQQPVLRLTEHTAAVKAIAWSPHQQGLLVSGGGTADRCIRFWNTANGNVLNSIDTGSQVCNLAWCKNVNELVSTHGYSQNQIMVWKYPSMSKVATLTGHTMRVLYLASSPDGQTIVTGAGDETLRFWNIFPSVKTQTPVRDIGLWSFSRSHIR